MLKKLINNYIQKNVKDKESVAILFSGGMDSLSLLLSCLELGIKPVLYTFYLKSHISKDIESSRKISILYNLQLNEIEINDDDLGLLINDIHFIIKKFNTWKKTQIQCIYPFLYIRKNVKEKFVLSGLCADDLYGSSKKMALIRKNTELFNKIRISKIEDIHASSYYEIKTLFEELGQTFLAPYKDSKEINEFFMKLNYSEMNYPKLKTLTLDSYSSEINKNKLYRRNSNLQCDSKIRESHARLIETSLNTRQLKDVIGIYRDMFKDNIIN